MDVAEPKAKAWKIEQSAGLVQQYDIAQVTLHNTGC
jgi:hypothetical protein